MDYEGTTDEDALDAALNRVPDVRFVIDSMLAQSRDAASRFSRRIDTSRIGIAGHSFGGFTALAAERVDARIDAALSLDPSLDEKLLGGRRSSTPTMIIASELGNIEEYGPRYFEGMTYGLLRGPKYYVELLRADHLAYLNDCTPYCGPPTTLTQEEAHRLILRFAIPFLQRYVGRDRRFDSFLLDTEVPGTLVKSDSGRRRSSVPFRPAGAR